ncbi:unnamed protein product [Meganyctiphanes norvegica]|uniref:NADP-dependent oxidoreductase domain-containing protein n=1 Tax=Meganyctiphanes norvegica TaxID=48144 RepID=A0AAV2Q8W8_MEGNR
MSVKVPSIPLYTGQEMPVIGIGTWRAKDQEIHDLLNMALESGYRHIDTAFMYQNESAIGDVLEAWFSSGRLKREDLFITTKLPMNAMRASDVERFLQKSLAAMKIDYVDLYLVHNPVGMKNDEKTNSFLIGPDGSVVLDLTTDHVAIWKAMEAQVDAGRTKAIGISNFNSKQIQTIIDNCRIRPANMQIEIHAYHQQKELREIASRHGMTVCAFAPLGAPYKGSGSSEFPQLLEHPVVCDIAKRLGKTPAQVLSRFLIQLGLIVIPKSSKPERVKQNFQVCDFELSAADMSAMEALDRRGKGRIFTFDIFKGINSHPEWPMHIPF